MSQWFPDGLPLVSSTLQYSDEDGWYVDLVFDYGRDDPPDELIVDMMFFDGNGDVWIWDSTARFRYTDENPSYDSSTSGAVYAAGVSCREAGLHQDAGDFSVEVIALNGWPVNPE